MKFTFSAAEKKLLIKVLVISLCCTLVVVGGTWLYFKIKLSRSIAKHNLATSTKIQPLDVEAHREIALHYMNIGAPEKAMQHLERIHSLNKNDLEIIKNSAQASLETGYYDKALLFYDELIEKSGDDSSDATTCARRGIALFYLNRVEESYNALIECLAHCSTNAEAFCFLGQIEASRDLQSPKAVDYFNRSIAIDSSYTEAWYQLARYYSTLKIYTKARELLIESVTRNPFHSKSYSRLGMIYYYLDYPDLAKKSYQNALLLNPGDFNTWYNLAELQISSYNDTAAALQNYKQALELNPQLYEAAFRIGKICLRNNMAKEAIGYFEKALAVTPHEIDILLQYATAWENIDRKDKAADAYATVLSVDELNSIARQKLKLLAESSGEAIK